MRRFLLKVIYLFFCLFITDNIVQSQQKDILFSHITTEDGLSQNRIDHIIKDSRGFMWFATWNGLNKYDGYKLESFFKSEQAEKGPSSNIVHYLCEDQFGNIWIGTENGLSVFLYKKNIFVHHFLSEGGLSSNAIVCLKLDEIGKLWVGTLDSGLDVFTIYENGEINRIEHFDKTSGKIKTVGNRIFNINNDESKDFWVCTDEGITKISRDLSGCEDFSSTSHPFLTMLDTHVYSMLESAGYYWFGTQTCLLKVNFTKEECIPIYNIPGLYGKLPHNTINDITTDSQGNIIIGTSGGLSILDTKNYSISNYIFNTFKFRGLNNNFINCVYADNIGNVWIGTENGGVNKFNIYQKYFEYFTSEPGSDNSLNESSINSVFEDDENIFIGTAGGGLNVYNKKRKKISYFINRTGDNNSISSNYITSIKKDKNNYIWLGTWGGGLSRIHVNNLNIGKFERIRFFNPSKPGTIGRHVSSMEIDGLNNLWVGSYEGLDRITPTGEITNFDSIGISRIGCLLSDISKQLWIGTERGLYMLKSKSEKQLENDTNQIVKTVFFPDSTVNSISGYNIISMDQQEDGNIWVGTYNNGVNLLEMNFKTSLPDTIIHYTTKNGLANNIVYNIIEDNSHNLWFSTDNGLSKYNPLQNKFINFYTNDGLLSNQFYWSAAFKNKYGKIYFGSTSGLHGFYPDSILERVDKPEIMLTHFKIFNQLVYPGSKDSPLKNHINNTDEIVLSHTQNTFSIDFVAINYHNAELFDYSFFMENVDKKWVKAENNLTAGYTKLNPGKYWFQVKAYEKSNPENYSIKRILITIVPPFYQKWWFRILIVLLIITLVVLIYHYRASALRNKNQLLEEIVGKEAKELKERNEEINNKNEEILVQKELVEEYKKEVEKSNRELDNYRNKLENFVGARINDLLIAKEKAEESDKLKSSFLANLSHEIRTPLNSIIGFTTLMFDDDLNEEEKEEFKAIIDSSCNSLMELINDVLDISKIESQRLELTISKVPLEKVFRALKGIYDYEIKLHQAGQLNENLEFKMSIDKELLSVVLDADEARLIQVMSNLMNNAIKFTYEGTVEVGCSLIENDKKVLFFVKDTGIGIKERNKEVIFQRFRKIEDNNDDVFRGAGLGLAISLHLVQQMGGNLWVESDPGKGSIFYFTLPVNHEKESKQMINDEFNNGVPNLEGKLILVAEDDYANFQLLDRLLRKTKVNILHAKNGKQAFELLTQNSDIELVLMDIKMPIMTGVEVLKEMQKSNINIPVIAQTAYAFAEEVTKIREEGFDEYITKPILKNDLFKLLAKYMT